MKFGFVVSGFDELKRKTADPEKELLAEPWAEGMESLGTLGESLAVRSAPLGPTGRTISMMYHRVQSKPMPMWARVGTKATATTGKKYPGYRYPRRVNYDPKSKRRGWFERSMAETKQYAGKIMDVVARKIEDRWAK